MSEEISKKLVDLFDGTTSLNSAEDAMVFQAVLNLVYASIVGVLQCFMTGLLAAFLFRKFRLRVALLRRNFFGLIADLCVGACVVYVAQNYYFIPKLVDWMMVRIGVTIMRWPLIEGRSKVAESFCDDAIQLVQESFSILFRDGVKEPLLWGVVVFAGNCERRRAYENHLRLRQPRFWFSPVEVPPPGVPPDFPVKGGAADQRFRNDSGFNMDNHLDWRTTSLFHCTGNKMTRQCNVTQGTLDPLQYWMLLGLSQSKLLS